MTFSDIVNNEYFARLCVPIRVALQSPQWRHRHPEIPFWTLYDRFTKLGQGYTQFPEYQADYINALRALLDAIGKATPRLAYHADDIDGYLRLMDEQGRHVVAMFAAYASAADSFVTPVEAAEFTGTVESLWRNRAAAGDIPGAMKKGKQWLLPKSVLSAVYGVDIPRGNGRPEHDESEYAPEPEMTEAEYHETMRQLNRDLN